MTSSKINSLAEEAAENAVDAHGVVDPPSAMDGYAFVRQLAFELEQGPPILRGREFRQFQHDYRRHLRNRGVCLAVAQTK